MTADCTPATPSETEMARLKTLLKLRDWQVKQNHASWVRAAKLALAGDTRALHLKVDMAEAPPVRIVAS